MKKVILILLCLVSTIDATTWYVSKVGNDTNGGTSWGDAELTIGAALAEVAAGDTIAIGNGTYTEEPSSSTDGSSGNLIVILDSTDYTDGFSVTTPDTVWGVKTSGAIGFNLQSDTYHKIIGLWFESSTYGVQFVYSSCNNNIALQCKTSGTGKGFYVTSSATDCSLISNLIISSQDWGTIDVRSNATNLSIINNTIYSSGNTTMQFENTSSNITLKNNIVYSTSGSSANAVVDVVDVDAVLDWDYNLYFDDNLTNWFQFNGTDGNTTAAWVDSVDNYDGDGATNSLNSDPSLQATTTTCFIGTGSVAYNSGTDLGYGTSMGYFQIAAAAPSSTPSTKPKGKPFIFGKHLDKKEWLAQLKK